MEAGVKTTEYNQIMAFESGLEKLVDDFFSDARKTRENFDTVVVEIRSLNLENMYKECFPKVCNNCSKTFNDQREYAERTEPLKFSDGKISQYDNKCGMIEYANCTCGTTLVLLLRSGRNESKFGNEKRHLFDKWRDKLSDQYPEVDTSDLTEILRFLYRHV